MVEKGDRVELVHTNDEYTELEPGAKGTVTSITTVPAAITGGRKERQINIDWDSGSTLSLIEGVDQYRVIS